MHGSILDQFARLSAAEEFFQVLDMPYDPAVLDVARLHILRRMRAYLAAIPAELPAAELREACRAALARAHDDFVHSRPIEQRVFKVLQDAVAPRPRAGFVPIATLSAPGQG